MKHAVLWMLILAVAITSAWAGLSGGGYALDDGTTAASGANNSSGYQLNAAVGDAGSGTTLSAGGYTLTGAFLKGPSVPPTTCVPVILVSASSRRTQGVAGTFDLNMPIAGSPGIEPRQGAATSNPAIVFTFSGSPCRAAGGSISCSDFIVTNGSCQNVGVSGNSAVVTLNPLAGAKNKCLTVAATGVSVTGDNDVSIILREGDVQQNGNVNILDLQAVKNQLNIAVTQANARDDINNSGSINILDLQACKNNLNQAAACP